MHVIIPIIRTIIQQYYNYNHIQIKLIIKIHSDKQLYTHTTKSDFVLVTVENHSYSLTPCLTKGNSLHGYHVIFQRQCRAAVLAGVSRRHGIFSFQP
jgi:hypothetical protein